MTTFSNSDNPEITHRQITATVKWFNPTKGFGFVQPSDGSGDAFLHVSVIERAGHSSLPEGATIICDLSAGQKGSQVAEVHSVESEALCWVEPLHQQAIANARMRQHIPSETANGIVAGGVSLRRIGSVLDRHQLEHARA